MKVHAAMSFSFSNFFQTDSHRLIHRLSWGCYWVVTQQPLWLHATQGQVSKFKGNWFSNDINQHVIMHDIIRLRLNHESHLINTNKLKMNMTWLDGAVVKPNINVFPYCGTKLVDLTSHTCFFPKYKKIKDVLSVMWVQNQAQASLGGCCSLAPDFCSSIAANVFCVFSESANDVTSSAVTFPPAGFSSPVCAPPPICIGLRWNWGH